jgi:catechol 2,3-dioxygenase-like lactoylglutathione lyase family enzyme
VINHVALETAPADGPAAVAFWRELGFELIDAPATLRDRAAWLERNGTQIHLLWTEQPTISPDGHAAVVVPDYAATLDRLRAAGHTVDERARHWNSPRAFATAPGGHRVELMEAPPTPPTHTHHIHTAVVTGVDFISVPTRDIDAARHFYETVLGLRCSAAYDRVPGAEFEAGNLTIQVIDAAAIGREFRAQAFPIALRVDDVDAARAGLEAQGVVFTHAFDSGVCHNAAFTDPDGNVLMLHHRYAPRAAGA